MGETIRRFAIGIDTGGTYTDAVVYEKARNAVVAKAKSPTTHDDLALGIGRAIDRVLADTAAAVSGFEAAAVEMVAVSTTLATNALVEGTGRPACLVTIGFDEGALDRGGLREAIGNDQVIVVAGGHGSHGEEVEPLDVEALTEAIEAIAGQVDAFAVTAQFATRNPAHELAARDLIRRLTALPVTCSHRLSARLNAPKRGVTALLNARLVPMIDELVTATVAILRSRQVDAPMMIVRGNGSLVSVDFVRDRPVETIMSGPAASLIGASHLAGRTDAVIVDIGGTTTDVAIIEDGEPQFAADGADVGGHRTMVEAVRMYTHGLGGDSEVGLADRAVGAEFDIGPRRVVPISAAADRDRDAVMGVLQRQLLDDLPGPHDGRLVSRTARADSAILDVHEGRVLALIGSGMVAVDAVVASSVQLRALDRLVGRALVRLVAFTPTDASHVVGQQVTFDPEPARLAARLMARQRDRFGTAIADSEEQLASLVIAAFVRRSALAVMAASFDHDGLSASEAQSPLVAAALDSSCTSTRLDVGLAVPLVALGAPASTYYPDVGALLDSVVEIPPHAEVANALGAVVGKVRVRTEISVTAPRRGVYRIHGTGEPETLWERPDAQKRALEIARAGAVAAASEAGAADIEVTTSWQEKVVDVDGRPMFVEGTAFAEAAGPPRLA